MGRAARRVTTASVLAVLGATIVLAVLADGASPLTQLLLLRALALLVVLFAAAEVVGSLLNGSGSHAKHSSPPRAG